MGSCTCCPKKPTQQQATYQPVQTTEQTYQVAQSQPNRPNYTPVTAPSQKSNTHVAPSVQRSKSSKQTIQDKISMAQKTKNLSLSEFQLSKVPDTIYIDGLVTLDISNNPIKTFLPKLTSLVNLKNLYCTNCALASLPNDLGNCSKLREIRAANNKIASLQITGSNIVKFDISFNILSDVYINNLPHLETLNLGNNRISNFPQISEVPKLVTLDLSNNQISQVPTTYSFPKLANLNLAQNRLSSIPPQLFSDTVLTKLILTGNQLTAKQVQEIDTVDQYLERRKQRVDKALWQDIDIKNSLCGL